MVKVRGGAIFIVDQAGLGMVVYWLRGVSAAAMRLQNVSPICPDDEMGNSLPGSCGEGDTEKDTHDSMAQLVVRADLRTGHAPRLCVK